MKKIKIGLVIAKPERDSISEIEKYITEEADILMFPEGYLQSKNLKKVQAIAKKNKKWIVTGMDDRRDKSKKMEAGIIIDSDGRLVGEHFKTSITQWEVDHGFSRGNSIKVINTKLGKFGFAICYEVHFPEVARALAINGVEIILNPIGTGMWHEEQFKQWNAVAKTRASENNAFVVGCSHFNDAIPMAYAYAPGGECLISVRDVNRMVMVTLDPEKYKLDKNFSQRRPELYKDLTK